MKAWWTQRLKHSSRLQHDKSGIEYLGDRNENEILNFIHYHHGTPGARAHPPTEGSRAPPPPFHDPRDQPRPGSLEYGRGFPHTSAPGFDIRNYPNHPYEFGIPEPPRMDRSAAYLGDKHYGAPVAPPGVRHGPNPNPFATSSYGPSPSFGPPLPPTSPLPYAPAAAPMASLVCCSTSIALHQSFVSAHAVISRRHIPRKCLGQLSRLLCNTILLDFRGMTLPSHRCMSTRLEDMEVLQALATVQQPHRCMSTRLEDMEVLQALATVQQPHRCMSTRLEDMEVLQALATVQQHHTLHPRMSTVGLQLTLPPHTPTVLLQGHPSQPRPTPIRYAAVFVGCITSLMLCNLMGCSAPSLPPPLLSVITPVNLDEIFFSANTHHQFRLWF